MVDAEEIETLRSRIAELQKQLKEERDEFGWDLKATKESSEVVIRKLKEEIATLKENQNIISQPDEKSREVNQLKGELAQMRIASGQMMEQLDRETERLKSDLKDAQKKHHKYKKQEEALHREITRLQGELSVTERERDELVIKVRGMRGQVAEVKETSKSVSEKDLDKPTTSENGADEKIPGVKKRKLGLVSGLSVNLGRFSKGFTHPGEAPLPPESHLVKSKSDKEDLEQEPERVEKDRDEADEDQQDEIGRATTQKIDQLVDQAELNTEIVAEQAWMDAEMMNDPALSGGNSVQELNHDHDPTVRSSSSKVAGWVKIAGPIAIVGVVLGVSWVLLSKESTQTPATPVAKEENRKQDTHAVDNIETSAGKQPVYIEKSSNTTEEESSNTVEEEKSDATREDNSNATGNESSSATGEAGSNAIEEQKSSYQDAGLVRQIQRLLKRKKHRQAIKALSQWVKKYPEDAELRYLYGFVLYQKHKLKSSVYQLEKAIELEPQMAKAYYQLGNVYLKQKQRKKACKTLKDYLRLEPSGKLIPRVKAELKKQRCM